MQMTSRRELRERSVLVISLGAYGCRNEDWIQRVPEIRDRWIPARFWLEDEVGRKATNRGLWVLVSL